MSDEERREGNGPAPPVGPPIIAQVAVHPETGQLMIFLNDHVPKEEHVTVCLAAAQTFIGLASTMIERQPRKPQIMVPSMVMPPGLKV